MNKTPIVILKIDDEVIDLTLTKSMSSFRYEENEDKDDIMTVDLKLAGNDLSLIDSDLIKVGKEITFSFGYAGGIMSAQKKAIIKKPEPEFGSSISLKLTALDKGNGMKASESNFIWENKTYSEIAIEIANKYYLTPIVDETSEVIENLPQQNRNDFDFLKHLTTQVRDFIFYINNDELHFHKRRYDEPSSKTFDYYQSKNNQILYFKPGIQTENQVLGSTDTKVLGFNPKTKETVSYVANNENEEEEQTQLGKTKFHISAEDASVRKEENQSSKIIATEKVQEAEVKAVAQSHKDTQSSNNIISTMRIVGDPLMLAKSVITLRGLGKRFSGNYYIKTAIHTINSSGYRTEFNIQRNALNKPLSNESVAATNTNETIGPEESPSTKKRVYINAESGEAT